MRSYMSLSESAPRWLMPAFLSMLKTRTSLTKPSQ